MRALDGLVVHNKGGAGEGDGVTACGWPTRLAVCCTGRNVWLSARASRPTRVQKDGGATSYSRTAGPPSFNLPGISVSPENGARLALGLRIRRQNTRPSAQPQLERLFRLLMSPLSNCRSLAVFCFLPCPRYISTLDTTLGPCVMCLRASFS
jgi:hypothetical protein